ncbi:MAG: glutaminyl-peptide cyclotransferase, partial [Brevundimonas sp.]
RVSVTADGRPVDRINELEWIDGEVWANIWQTDRIARIDPETGQVKAWIDLTGLYRLTPEMDPVDDVLNGIAWDREGDRIFVTGKRWSSLFEIETVAAP